MTPEDQDAQIYDFPGSAVDVSDPMEMSASTDLVEWVPADVPTVRPVMSIIDVRILPPRSEVRVWLDECRGGLELRAKSWTVHATRSWLYAARASRHSGRGLLVVLRYWWRWVRDSEALWLRRDLAVDPSLPTDVRAKRHAETHAARLQRVRVRWAVTIGGAVSALILAPWLKEQHPALGALIGLAAIVGLGLIGAQRHEIVPYEAAPTEMVISVDAVVRAFYKAKVAKDAEDPVTVIGVPHKQGLGVVVRVEVPEGVTFDDVLKAKDRLASALHCPKQCLELDDLPDDAEALLELFIADKPPSKVKVPHWPLMDTDRADIFRPIPVGWTPRGDLVYLSLLWVHTLIGAAPRRGKTTILRMLALATLLDPRAQLIIVDFGGGSDHKPLQPFCLRFIHGPANARIEEFLGLLHWLNAEYERRQAVLAELPISVCPEGRLTPALAERPELGPITVIVDEFQVATLTKEIGDEPKMGEVIVRDWASLQKVCAKVGITIVEATQSADESVPTELRNTALQRVALSMASFQASMAVLGNTAQKLGYDASTLGGLPGLGYSWGTDSGDVDGYRGKVRFANVTPADAAALLERIARVRTKVTIAAVDRAPASSAKPAPPIVVEALRVWPHPEVAAHQVVLAEAMGIRQMDLGAQLRGLGLRAQQVKVGGVNLNGYYLADVQRLTKTRPEDHEM